METKTCIQCKKLFSKPQTISKKNWTKRKFCSRGCKHNYGRVEIECKFCGKKFIVWKHKKDRKFCSAKCSQKVNLPPRQGIITGKICVFCGKEFFVPSKKRREKQIYCSLRCRGKVIRGIKHSRWKGGQNFLYDSLRHSEEYRKWRKAVYQRDYWTCQICKIKQRHPTAHHIKNFWEHEQLRFDIKNGITLCKSCHIKIHKIKNKVKK